MRHPRGQRDEILGHGIGQDRVGLDEALGRDLGAIGDPDDDAQHATVTEPDPQDRADADLTLVGAQPVVERAAHGACERQRLHARDRGW